MLAGRLVGACVAAPRTGTFVGVRGTRFALLVGVLTSLVLAAPTHAAYAPLDRPGPTLEVPRAQLDAALQCTPGIAGATRAPVLLSPATGVTAEQNYSWYVAKLARATLVFRTRRGRVGATGIAARRLTRDARATRRLLRAWDLRG